MLLLLCCYNYYDITYTIICYYYLVATIPTILHTIILYNYLVATINTILLTIICYYYLVATITPILFTIICYYYLVATITTIITYQNMLYTISQQTPYAEEHYWLVNTHYLYGECLDAEIAYRISVKFLV